jgi:hypothetical protein
MWNVSKQASLILSFLFVLTSCFVSIPCWSEAANSSRRPVCRLPLIFRPNSAAGYSACIALCFWFSGRSHFLGRTQSVIQACSIEAQPSKSYMARNKSLATRESRISFWIWQHRYVMDSNPRDEIFVFASLATRFWFCLAQAEHHRDILIFGHTGRGSPFRMGTPP